MDHDPHSPFARAVLALDTGNLEELRALLAVHPGLVDATGPSREGDYFAGSTLLHYVAWNPYPSHREPSTRLEKWETPTCCSS